MRLALLWPSAMITPTAIVAMPIHKMTRPNSAVACQSSSSTAPMGGRKSAHAVRKIP